MSWPAFKAWALEGRVHLLLFSVAMACLFLLTDSATPR